MCFYIMSVLPFLKSYKITRLSIYKWTPRFLKGDRHGVREPAQWLIALVALAEDPGLILTTHMVAHNQMLLQF